MDDPDILWTAEQTCTINHWMDQSMWHKNISFDLLHSLHNWIQTILSCWKLQNSTDKNCFRTLVLTSKGFFFYIFGSPYVCSIQLDVLETNFNFAQFNRIWNHFLGCRIKVGRFSRAWYMGSDRRSSSRKHVSEWSRTERPVEISNAKEISWDDGWSRQCWFYFLKREFFSSGSFVVCVWRQRSSDQYDLKRKKPDNKTCFQNRQSCLWLVVR